MTNKDKMQLTIDHAREALDSGEMPIAASVFFGDELVSNAYTTEKKDQRFLVHAELKALMEADMLKHDIPVRKKMQLFTTLEPCLMCYGSAMSFFIGEIYYSLSAPDDGAQSLIKFGAFTEFLKYQRPKLEGGILLDGAKEQFRLYMSALDRDSHLYSFSRSIVEKCNGFRNTLRTGMAIIEVRIADCHADRNDDFRGTH